MSELVTGDAVVLGLRPARLPSRALSVTVDLVVVWGVYLTMSFAVTAATASLDDAAFTAVQAALLVLVLVGGPIAVETLSHGRSLGKVVCGLRVVREDGGPIRFRHALVRGAMGFVEIMLSFGVIACIASLVSARGRRLGDVFAGTLVVRERIPAGRPVSLPAPPPGATGRFRALDLSRVPEGLWLAVRQYLMRRDQLDDAVSRSMAQRLASDVAACTGAPPPTELPPADYLAGVVAERQARDAQRVFGGRTAGGPPGAAAPPATAPADAAGVGYGGTDRPSGVWQGAPPAAAGRAAVTPMMDADRADTGPAAPPPGGPGGGAAPAADRSTGFVPPA